MSTQVGNLGELDIWKLLRIAMDEDYVDGFRDSESSVGSMNDTDDQTFPPTFSYNYTKDPTFSNPPHFTQEENSGALRRSQGPLGDGHDHASDRPPLPSLPATPPSPPHPP